MCVSLFGATVISYGVGQSTKGAIWAGGATSSSTNRQEKDLTLIEAPQWFFGIGGKRNDPIGIGYEPYLFLSTEPPTNHISSPWTSAPSSFPAPRAAGPPGSQRRWPRYATRCSAASGGLACSSHGS